MHDIGICEMPPGSNRSGRIDEYNRRAGVALGSYWCASAAGIWHLECGAWTPKGYASCDEWLRQGEGLGLRRPAGQDPEPGDVVLYGVGRDAVHIGLIIRTVIYPASRLILSVEGNTSVGGAAVARNGVAVAMKAVDEKRVLCYLTPRKAT
jgi:hypothetical protein